MNHLGHELSLTIAISIDVWVHSVLQATSGGALACGTRTIKTRPAQASVTLTHAFSKPSTVRASRGSLSSSRNTTCHIAISHARSASSAWAAKSIVSAIAESRSDSSGLAGERITTLLTATEGAALGFESTMVAAGRAETA
jgi:hypothetical protein